MEKSTSMYKLFCEHSCLTDVSGDITVHLSNAVNKVMRGQAIGAQKIRSLWAICVRSQDAVDTLHQTGIVVNNTHIPLHKENPYGVEPKVEGERVLIKDYPLWEPDNHISDCFKRHPQIKHISKVYRSKARNSPFLNGDRFLYMNTSVHPPIPDRIQIGTYTCRVQYASRNRLCERCNNTDHKTSETNVCPAYITEQPDVHYFSRGILSNFSRCVMKYEDNEFLTSEHTYQYLACIAQNRRDLADDVMHSTTPREAKAIASRIKNPNGDWHTIKYGVMEKVIRAKVAQSEEFRTELLSTGDKMLIEALPDADWGSGLPYHISISTKPEFHPGKSWLGNILMIARAQLQRQSQMTKPVVPTTENPVEKPTEKPSEKPLEKPAEASQKPAHRGRPSASKGQRGRVAKASPSRKSFKNASPLLKGFLINQAKLKATTSQHSDAMDTDDSRGEDSDDVTTQAADFQWYDVTVTGDTDTEEPPK